MNHRLLLAVGLRRSTLLAGGMLFGLALPHPCTHAEPGIPHAPAAEIAKQSAPSAPSAQPPNKTRLDADLLRAAEANDFVKVKELLKQGANIRAKGEYGQTALIWAVVKRNVDMVRYLLTSGSDPNGIMYGYALHERNAEGGTALSFAIQNGDLPIVEALIAGKVDIEAPDEENRKPLDDAVLKGDVRIVKALLDAGVKPDDRDVFDGTPLMSAPSVEIMQLLLERGAKIEAQDRYGATPLYYHATLAAHARFLLDRGADPNRGVRFGETALQSAVKSGWADAVRVLLDGGAAMDYHRQGSNTTGESLVREAASAGYADVVKLLLERGAFPDLKMPAGVSVLGFSGNRATMQVLLDAGVDVHMRDSGGGTALLSMAYNGDADRLKLLLERGADLHAENDIGMTALLEAASSSNVQTVRFLLDVGADPRARIKKTDDAHGLHEGDTALMVILNGDDRGIAVLRLLDRRVDVNAANSEGVTALMHAATFSDPRAVQELLAHGAHVNAKDNTGRTALSWALHGRFGPWVEVVNALVQGGATVDAPDRALVTRLLKNRAEQSAPSSARDKALLTAISRGRISQAMQMLAGGADPNARGGYDKDPALLAAAEQGSLRLVQRLLSRGADVNGANGWGETPLMAAAQAGHADIVSLLLKHKAEVNQRDGNARSALLVATTPQIRDLLLRNGADVNAQDRDGNSRLILKSGWYGGGAEGVKEVEALVNWGADLEFHDASGKTALMLAAEFQNNETLTILLNRSANPFATDNAGMTALLIAVQARNLEGEKILLHHGSDLQATDWRGRNALCILMGDIEELIAPHPEDLAMVRLLLEQGIHVNAQDKEGNTPLITAVVQGRADIVRLLLSKGADVHIKSFTGETALMRAQAKDRADIVALLKQAGATE